ncbi:MAG: aspartyl/glutamyl-tRNA amidotransferase subunit C [Ruminococcus sp.]
MAEVTINAEHIAKLARLEFTGEELLSIRRDMEDIIGMVSNLPDTKNYPLIVKSAQMRADELVDNTVDREEILQTAPQVYDGCIAVPRTVE